MPAPSNDVTALSHDAEARRRIRDDLDSTLIVEAAAGTGKTTMLVSRILGILRAGKADLDCIIAVTFTEKAAGEMKLRLRAAIETARTAADTTSVERGRLDRALAHLEVARIGTIHSLCGDLLREHPVEAAIDPLFEVAPEDESARLFEGCFDAWFEATLRAPPEGVRRILRRRAGGRDGIGARKTLRDAAWKLADQRDYSCPFRRDPFDREAALSAAVDALSTFGELAPLADRPSEFLAVRVEKVRAFVADLRRRERISGRDLDGLEAELALVPRSCDLHREIFPRGIYGKGLTRAEVVRRRDVAREILETTLDACNADLAACLQQELWPILALYDARKARAGKLDFLDLLLRTRDLVRGNRQVRDELAQRIHRIFVDEFQDTDPLQAEILLLLAGDDAGETSYTSVRPIPGKLFLVGDPKQSIYRFRRADVALYESIKERLVRGGASLLYLTRSFRSAPAIQDAVNVAFAGRMMSNAERSQAAYVALERHRDDIGGQPGVVALPVPRPYSPWGKITDFAIRASLPDAVGAFIDWLVHESGWVVSERDHPERRSPIEARHVCLLFKRFQSFGDDITRAYVRALEARHIPHVLVGGRSFYDREEVLAVHSALLAIEWPDDELSVYATLHGPFFALSDVALLAYRSAIGKDGALGHLNPLHAPEALLDEGAENDVREVVAALTILRKLHIGRNHRPIADTLERLLAETRAHAGIAIWPTGEQALANVLRVLDMARRFEARGATSFRVFVERLEADAESGAAGEAPVVEEGTEGVRIMTVHRAKGLEFPVVILADPTAPTTLSRPTRHVDPERGLWAEAIAGCMPAELVEHRCEVLRRDAEEALRLAYVAATRARDLLVIPAVGDEPHAGWFDVLNSILYPDPMDWRAPTPAPGCPPFGNDSVLDRPMGASRDAEGSVAPGQHRGPSGKPNVAWWDPGALGLGKEPEGGLRQHRILAADNSSTVSDDGVLAHRAWSEGRATLIESGARQTLPVKTVTQLVELERPPIVEATSEGETRAPVEVLDSGVDRRGRPRGKRFGTLVHAVLAEVDLEADVGAVVGVAQAEGRGLGATGQEIEAAAVAALAALDHPLMHRARASVRRGECRRETAILLPGPGDGLIEGVVDLAFRETGIDGVVWTVVDFKTDTDLGTRRARYETQVLLYAKAIAAATGESARGVLFSV